MSPKRRDVLRAGGVAALLSGGLAGCIEDVTDAPGEERPAYADWLFDTSTLLEASFRGFYAVDVAAYREQQAALPAEANETLQHAAKQYDGVAVEDFDRVTGLGAFADPNPDDYGDEQFVLTSVGTGSFDSDAVAGAIEANSEVSAAGEYEGYDLYTRRNRYSPGNTAAAAVGDDAVVLTVADAGGEYRNPPRGETPPSPSGTPAGGVSAERAAKLHVDAGAGGSGGLLAGNDQLDQLAGALDGPIVGGIALDAATLRERIGLSRAEQQTSTPEADGRDGNDNGGSGERTATTPTMSEPEPSPVQRHLRRVTLGLTAFGGSADATGASDGEVVFRLLYEDESAASDGAAAVRDLRDALRAEVDAFTVPEVEVATEGAAVAVTITGDPSAFYEELGFGDRDEPQPRAPQVSFSFERGEDGRVTVTHDGGDEVGTDGRIRLLYESGGERVDRRWQPDDGSITAGDSITTERPVADALRVVWESADGDAAATLGLYRPPQPSDAPQVMFDFEIGSENRVTVTHEGGDTIEQPLVVVYDSADGGRKELWEPDDGAIVAGESYTTETGLAEDGSVRVLWDGEETVTLAEFDGPSTGTPRRTRTAAPEDTRTATARESTATSSGTPTGTASDTSTGTTTAPSGTSATRTPTPVEDGTPTAGN